MFKTVLPMLVILLLSPLAAGQTMPGDAPAETQPPGPVLPPAPYQPLKAGTRLVYSSFENKITAVDGWRVTFQDKNANRGGWLALFIPDNPKSPLEFDPKQIAPLWPLQLGNHVTVTTRRVLDTWKWDLTVIRTEKVYAQMGTYDTYVIDGIERPDITAGAKPYVMLHRWWYAPALHTVLRYRGLQAGNSEGQYVNQPIQIELQRIDNAQ